MEDEDVERVNKCGTPTIEENNLDGPFIVNNDAKNITSPEKNKGEEFCETIQEDTTVNIDRLKSALINHDVLNVDTSKENEKCILDSNLSNSSPKKLNGEVDKCEADVILSEDSCKDNTKNKYANVEEDQKSEEKEEKKEETSVNEEKKEETSVNEEKKEETSVNEELKECAKRKRSFSGNSDMSKGSENESENELSSNSSPVEFKGFKKRKVQECSPDKLLNACESSEEMETANCSMVNEAEKPKLIELRRSARNASGMKKHSCNEAIINIDTQEESGDQLTEYAQYLGLQPTVKFKCGRCGEKHFQSMATLNAHQMICCKTSSNALSKQTKPTSDSNLSTNFRITRKVYLCSACGTYYENWKLFLHMRDMHKRHICLFCLGMFSVAERLAEHLLYQHNVHEKTCKSPEEFLNLFKGSCYLTCCSCEKMFTERDDFYDHQCKDSVAVQDAVSLTPKEIKELAQKCTLCGVKCGHFRTCPKVAHKFQQNAQPPSITTNVNTTSNSVSNMSLEKFYVPVPTNVQNNWPANNLNQEILKQALSLTHSEKDYYDVGSAARFCHVDMANDSDNQHSPEKAVAEKSELDRKKCPEYDGLKSPDVSVATDSKEHNEQADSAESLLNNGNNVIVNSVSDESNHSENRLSSRDSETQNVSPKKPNESLEEESVENHKTSTAEVIDNILTQVENRTENVDEIKDSEDEMSIENDNEVKDKESAPILNDNIQCFVKLERLKDKNSIVNSLSTDKEDEENSEHDSVSDSSSSGSDSNDSRRNSIDADHNDVSQDNVISDELVTDTEKNVVSDKKESPSEDLSINDEPVDKTLDDSSLNIEEKSSSLSNAESINNRYENNNETSEKSDGSVSEESDKLSVIVGEDEQTLKPDDEETKVCEDVPISKETDKDDGIDDHMETDATAERTDVECKDVCSDEEEDDDDDSDGEATQTINTENDVHMEESQNASPQKPKCFQCDGVSIQLANEEVTAMALMLDDKMDSLSSQSVVKECVRTSCTTCSYCSHAVKIGVNGKQLAIHLLTEHRYMPVKNETIDDIIERLKRSLDELQDVWFNTDSYDSSDKNCFVPYDHTYECFQCNYSANTHKDLFSHKRKVHQKTILYCSMCKENFYSYSELLCHMCPGLYDASKDIQFRCCMCSSDRIPSAFRLMVHLRKSHHTCDICLEIVDDQQKLSTHMVKHKLHHLCYRCGIAYRNKPDITKHLFWKHGTESVLCKKCLQKKWPHVYHFCIPPNSFVCEECNHSFTKAVHLKVHKRFHSNNLPYTCTTCEQKFVSKKLLKKHEKSHEVITKEENVNNDTNNTTYQSGNIEKSSEQSDTKSGEPQVSTPEQSSCPDQNVEISENPEDTVVKPHKKKSKKDKDRKVKPVVDVYDLPPLNLSSESDDTEDEKDTRSVTTTNDDDKMKESVTPVESIKPSELSSDEGKIKENLLNVNSEMKTADLSESVTESEETAPPITVVDGIWDNFHSYKAEQEKRENLDIANKQSILSQLDPTMPAVLQKEDVLGDHDYCLPPNSEEKEGHANETDDANNKTKSNEHSSSIDHDYCTQKDESLENSNINTSANLLSTSNQSENTETPPKRKQKSPKKKMKQHNNSSSSSDSSSDSDSSSCSCGTNCSCSSSSSNSSSSSSSDSDSSSSDGKNNQSGTSTNKREKKKERLKAKRKADVQKPPEPLPTVDEQPVEVQVPVEPEELLIKESDLETDETETDEEFYDQHPQMQANQILAEKRNQLMLLASVAPTVNNGTASPPVPNTSGSTNINLDPISSPKLEIVTPPVTPVVQPQTQSKKKVKAKKRRKSSSLSISRSRKQHSSYETPQPSTSFSTQWQSAGHGKKVVNEISPMYMQSPVLPHAVTPASNLKSDNHMLLSSPVTSHHSQSHRHSTPSSESSSSKRFSKRRRVRNKFYGYSSDEDGEHNQTPHPPTKWKKFSPVDGKQSVQQQYYAQSFQQSANAVHPEYNHGYQQQVTPAPPPPKIVQPAIRTTFDENQINNNLMAKRTTAPVPLSSGTSSDSEGDSDSDTSRLAINPQTNATSIMTTGLNATATEKDDKLYCYCQCPYDEVSEMIACDGIDCAIEWFHFECVGIMVPPKGKWYCPDCRKRRGLS